MRSEKAVIKKYNKIIKKLRTPQNDEDVDRDITEQWIGEASILRWVLGIDK